jgi:hypothetical protein
VELPCGEDHTQGLVLCRSRCAVRSPFFAVRPRGSDRYLWAHGGDCCGHRRGWLRRRRRGSQPRRFWRTREPWLTTGVEINLLRMRKTMPFVRSLPSA